MPEPATELLAASGNKKKLEELTAILGPLGVRVLGPADVGGLAEVEEDGDTFVANASKKARAGALATGRWTLADDSGLEVDCLEGAPGIFSARYAGEHGDDAANNARLLRELDGLPEEQRGAQFTCALALARPDGEIAASIQESCRGRIMESPRGENGFGYDPLFLFTEEGFEQCGKGFAELDGEEKSAVSHRGRALRRLAERFEELLASAS